MKKTIVIILIVSMVLVLAGCGKSEEAQKVDDLISSLGEITLDKGDLIRQAEEAVAALEAKDQKALDNIGALEEARTAYESLLNEEAAKIDEQIIALGTISLEKESDIAAARKALEELQPEIRERVKNSGQLDEAEDALNELKLDKAAEEITKLIEAVGEVDLESGQAIKRAREAYKAADKEIQDRVLNLETLEQAEKKYAELRVERVEGMIAGIGEVTLESEKTIKDAQAAMKELTAEEKAAVSNAGVLTDAFQVWLKMKKEADEKEITRLKYLMNIEEDKVRGMTFYTSKYEPYYADTRCYVSLYIGTHNNSPWLVSRVWYTGDSWVFWTKLTIMVDGHRYYRTYNRSNITRDNGGGNVWEYLEVIDPSAEDVELFRQIANSKETIIRFEGDGKWFDYTVCNEDKQGIKDVLALFELLK